jgi:hypothetical protein
VTLVGDTDRGTRAAQIGIHYSTHDLDELIAALEAAREFLHGPRPVEPTHCTHVRATRCCE